MALKRKRSSATISSPASIASTQSASPPPFFHHQSQPINIELCHKPTWSFPTYDDQPFQHLNSRTRKRYRNNRPDDQKVYASTITKLYAAQKQMTNASPLCSQPTTTPSPEPEQLPRQRTTLHTFWQLPQPPPASATAMEVECANDTSASCDLSRESGSLLDHDMAMDIDDIFVAQDMTCQSCQRQIHDNGTAVGNLRVCLPCAHSGYR